MTTNYQLIPLDDNDLTGKIDENIEYVNIEACDNGVVRIEFDYCNNDKDNYAANIEKDEAIRVAKQILAYYDVK